MAERAEPETRKRRAKRWSADDARDMLREWAQSGLSASAFAHRKHVLVPGAACLIGDARVPLLAFGIHGILVGSIAKLRSRAARQRILRIPTGSDRDSDGMRS